MLIVMKKLQDHDFLKGLHNDCSVCQVEPDYCDELKNYIQSLMDQGVIQFTKAKVSEEV